MKLLFQGDSITDAGRDRSDIHNMGHGYPLYASQIIAKRHPDTDFEFINLGISGNQTKDLVARLEPDFIDIQPDVVSIMIGINDTWHHAQDRSWIPNELFELNYRTVLEAIKTRTHAKLMMLEPYMVPVPDKLHFFPDMYAKIPIIRKLAKEYADVYMPTDGLIASLAIDHPYTDFSDDGVHPNQSGSQIIGALYADYIEKLL